MATVTAGESTGQDLTPAAAVGGVRVRPPPPPVYPLPFRFNQVRRRHPRAPLPFHPPAPPPPQPSSAIASDPPTPAARRGAGASSTAIPTATATVVVTTGDSESTAAGAEEEEEDLDLISRLPDGVLGDIVSLLPTRDGGRTQGIASRWRHLWRAAPLNLDLHGRARVHAGEVSRVLSGHRGPGRRFCAPFQCFFNLHGLYAETLEGWLQSPALDGLQELEFHHGPPRRDTPPPLPPSVCRFESTLRVASFGGCSFPAANGNAGGGALQLPLLKKLSLLDVRISEGTLQALLAGCPELQSFLLGDNNGCSVIRVVSPRLRSIGVRPGPGAIKLQRLLIEDAPCLERLLLLGSGFSIGMVISVIRASKLHVLGQLAVYNPRLEFGTTVLQGLQIASLTAVVHSVKVLAFTQLDLSLDVVINFMKCFPCLEKLYIKTMAEGEKNDWCQKYKNLIGTINIPLKKLVLTNYQGNKSHVNFAKFFVLNARVLESMRLELQLGNPSSGWIEKQRNLLQINDKASKDAQFDFVSHVISCPFSLGLVCAEQVHDLATADPFVGFHEWI